MEGARVVQVNVSAGGIPKTPVAEAWVGRLGVEGDAHRERTVHGGPHRAVCLFAVEAIERLQAEGHPVEPGSVGENLTTLGVEWSRLPLGTRARIGSQLLLELASPTMPCSTQQRNFLGGRFSRISIVLHPSDSRMYARVLREGRVRPGDAIELLPPAADSRAVTEALLMRIDPVERAASLQLWAAARAAGLDVRVLDDGDICAGASPTLPSRAFNHAHGLRLMPQLLPEILAHFDRVGSMAVVPHVPPTPDAQPVAQLVMHAADGDLAAPDEAADGVDVERVGARDAAAIEELSNAYVAEMEHAERTAWRSLLPQLIATRGVEAFLARLGGKPAGVGFLHVRRKVGLIKGAYVGQAARGRGIQRALIGARLAAAKGHACELVAATAAEASACSRNLQRLGLRAIDTYPIYEYRPR